MSKSLKYSFNSLSVLAGYPGLGDDEADIVNVAERFVPLQGYTPGMFLTTVLNLLLGAAGIASFIFLLWGGIQWILAGGDKEVFHVGGPEDGPVVGRVGAEPGPGLSKEHGRGRRDHRSHPAARRG